MADPGNASELIDNLKQIGMKTKQKIKTEDMPFKGMKFVFTGGLITLSRPDASELVKQKGGIVVSSVGKDIDYVVVGENPGSKYDKAKKLLGWEPKESLHDMIESTIKAYKK